jgi:stage V sporulation protein G
MPSRKAPDGEFRDIAHPINADTRGKIQNAILDKYDSISTNENEETQSETTEE